MTAGDGLDDMMAESNLCLKCAAIRFDDEQFGGYVTENASGDHELTFGDGYEDIEFVPEYKHEDLLPDLPRLEVSSQAGCDFCRALRAAILISSVNKTGTVCLSLRYLWHRGVHELGLKVLLVDLEIGQEDTQEDSPDFTLVFQVDCKRGMTDPRSALEEPQ
jgi:hypothetical protein